MWGAKAPLTLRESKEVAVIEHKNGGRKDEIEVFDVCFDSIDIRKAREDLSMTQAEFASTFGLAIGSVRNWEQQRSAPDASISSYLTVIKNNPEAVIQALDKERRKRRLVGVGVGVVGSNKGISNNKNSAK